MVSDRSVARAWAIELSRPPYRVILYQVDPKPETLNRKLLVPPQRFFGMGNMLPVLSLVTVGTDRSLGFWGLRAR